MARTVERQPRRCRARKASAPATAIAAAVERVSARVAASAIELARAPPPRLTLT